MYGKTILCMVYAKTVSVGVAHRGQGTGRKGADEFFRRQTAHTKMHTRVLRVRVLSMCACGVHVVGKARALVQGLDFLSPVSSTSTVMVSGRAVAAVLVVDAAAVALFVAFNVARHAPLEVFPASWRKSLIRWRKAHSQKAVDGASKRSLHGGAVARTHPYDKAAGEARFKAWSMLNDNATLLRAAGVTRRQRLELRPPLDQLFAGPSLRCRLARALAERHALDRKEFFETFELFEQVRGALSCGHDSQSRTCVECAAGHGLLGILIGALEQTRFDHVVVTDRRKPASFERCLEAAASVAPWIRELVSFAEADFTSADALKLLPAGCAVVCVHGCNSLTDHVIARAVGAAAESLAVMPCCYAHSEAAEAAPAALRSAMGVALAADVQRTYRLEDAGYEVAWRHIPSTITPMNRVLVARRRSVPAEKIGDASDENRVRENAACQTCQ